MFVSSKVAQGLKALISVLMDTFKKPFLRTSKSMIIQVLEMLLVCKNGIH